MRVSSLNDFYQELASSAGTELSALLPGGLAAAAGQFNVFALADLWPPTRTQPAHSYPCRSFYKISLLHERSQAEYADKSLAIEPSTLVFTTPNVPHYWRPQEPQTGLFCVFTPGFLSPANSGVLLDELPIFQAEDHPVFPLRPAAAARVRTIFERMQEEMASDYAFKYDLLRTYVLELIHLGQKLQPAAARHPAHSAAARLTSRFLALLEQQFPLETPQQRLTLRAATDYAEKLAVHVNHLNKVLKQTTGRTTTDLIGGRMAQEAQALLRQTNWTIAEIADTLGFADGAHFSHFFKRQTAVTPGAFRGAPIA